VRYGFEFDLDIPHNESSKLKALAMENSPGLFYLPKCTDGAVGLWETHMKSDPTLRKWFRIINKRFFGNEITDKVCVRWANEEDNDEEARCEEKYMGWADLASDGYHEYVIVLSRVNKNSPSTKLMTLCHEMCHLATKLKDDHGPAFEAQRQLIADRGIFKKNALRKGLTIF
jgi:hypothetical protein